MLTTESTTSPLFFLITSETSNAIDVNRNVDQVLRLPHVGHNEYIIADISYPIVLYRIEPDIIRFRYILVVIYELETPCRSEAFPQVKRSRRKVWRFVIAGVLKELKEMEKWQRIQSVENR